EDAGGFGYRLERSDRPRLTLRLRFRGRRRDRHDTRRLPDRLRLGAGLGDRLGTTGRRGRTRRCCQARLSRSSGAYLPSSDLTRPEEDLHNRDDDPGRRDDGDDPPGAESFDSRDDGDRDDESGLDQEPRADYGHG